MARRLALAVLAAAVVLQALDCVLGDATVGYGELEEEWRGEVVQLSWKPRAFLVKGFLTDEECDHIINMAKPEMEESAVVDRDTGKAKKSRVRTSTGAMYARGHDAVIRRIEKRIAQVTMIPVEHQEGLQVLRYVDGQKYEPHTDYFDDAFNVNHEHGGQRVTTMLMYLSTPEEGGETVFPDAEHKVTGPGWSECALKGLANKPKKGDALMFYSLTPDGKEDPASLHGSCPTLKGEKWSATKWIHVESFGTTPKPPPPNGPNDCVNTHEHCAEWAFFGECDKNKEYMLNFCKKACRVCDPFKQARAPSKADGPIKTQ